MMEVLQKSAPKAAGDVTVPAEDAKVPGEYATVPEFPPFSAGTPQPKRMRKKQKEETLRNAMRQPASSQIGARRRARHCDGSEPLLHGWALPVTILLPSQRR
jgi:hypothetical protein